MAGSRGKGNRRVPWRDGGAHKQKCLEWHRQARHAVSDKAELGEPLVALNYSGEWRKSAAVKIYKFDQKIAKTGICYHAEYLGWWAGFKITVHQEHREQVQSVIDEI